MMFFFYYNLVLLNAVVCVAAASVTYWRNRHHPFGKLFGATMLLLAVWLIGFAHYFRALPETAATAWALVTLTAAIAGYPLLFHSACALVEKLRAYRWWIAQQ